MHFTSITPAHRLHDALARPYMYRPFPSRRAESRSLRHKKNHSAIHPPAAAAIAERYEGDGATANVFGHCTLQEEEVHALYVAE
jgi:hypothetical protein